MSVVSSLFKRVIRLNEGTDLPPWAIQLWDDVTHEWHTIGRGLGGSDGSPIVAPGFTSYPTSEPLAFAGDPPDLLTFVGDVLYLRSWQPAFLTTENGDLLIAEGLD